MQSKPATPSSSDSQNLYEYAVIRFVPRVEREEFLNVGLVMMCKRRRWIRSAVHLDASRILAFCPEADMDTLREQLNSFSEISAGRSASPVASLDAHERFRWLTAVRSASIATSRPHPGHTPDLDKEFDRLLDELIL